MEMAKMENNEIKNGKLIPRLRFPGFEGEWEEKKLEEVCDIVMGQSPASDKYNTDGIGLPLIQGNADIQNRKSIVRYYTSQITKTCEKNDILMSVRAPVGSISRASNKACIGRGVCTLKNGNDFLYQYLIFIESSWEKLSAGSTFTCVNSDAIARKTIFLPPTPEEQQKIASCLSELDNLIAAQGQKVDALKEKKKGLMQQLFPQPGETTPRLRFPGFEGEWDFVNGDELFEPISNKEHNSDLPILALTQDQGAVPRDEINYNVIVSDKSVAGYKVVEVDDFIISLRSFQGGIEYSRYKGLCSPAYIVLRKKSKKLSSDFYRIYFKSFNYIQELNKNLEGIRDGKMISYKQFSEIKLPKPTISEQQKISSCLSSLDDRIAAESAKVEALKDHKKGLMQQLFPQGSEISRFSNTDAQECAVSSEISRFSDTHLQTDARECAEPLGDAQECDEPLGDAQERDAP